MIMGDLLTAASVFLDQWLMPSVLVVFLAWLAFRSRSRS
jgi:hypothetical protein